MASRKRPRAYSPTLSFDSSQDLPRYPGLPTSLTSPSGRAPVSGKWARFSPPTNLLPIGNANAPVDPRSNTPTPAKTEAPAWVAVSDPTSGAAGTYATWLPLAWLETVLTESLAQVKKARTNATFWPAPVTPVTVPSVAPAA